MHEAASGPVAPFGCWWPCGNRSGRRNRELGYVFANTLSYQFLIGIVPSTACVATTATAATRSRKGDRERRPQGKTWAIETAGKERTAGFGSAEREPMGHTFELKTAWTTVAQQRDTVRNASVPARWSIATKQRRAVGN